MVIYIIPAAPKVSNNRQLPETGKTALQAVQSEAFIIRHSLHFPGAGSFPIS